MNSMVEVLASHANKQPGKLFVADSFGNNFSYLDSWNNVQHAAYVLSTKYNVRKGTIVMCECLQDSFFLLSKLALELIQAIIVPIENGASINRKEIIAQETECKLWIGKSGSPSKIISTTYEELFDDHDNVDSFNYSFPPADAVSEILYTTGTTGTSKGIVICNSANIALAENIVYGVRMLPSNVEMVPVPISHSHGLRCCYANLLNGSTVVIVDGLLNIKKFFLLMDQYGATALDVSPSAISMIIKLSKGLFWDYARKLDYIQIGTASLSSGIKNELLNNLKGVRLYNFYGSTESGRSCVLDFSQDKNKDNCIGKATQNAEILFVDDDRNVINANYDSPGLLASRGPMNMKCYWKNDALTDITMRNGFVFTNDLGYADEDGFIYILGRKGDVINYNGIKISPEEIEEAALKCEFVEDACCVPQRSDQFGQFPKLYVSLRQGTVYDKKILSEILRKNVDANKLPKEIETIDKIPRTSNGKLKRSKLVEK